VHMVVAGRAESQPTDPRFPLRIGLEVWVLMGNCGTFQEKGGSAGGFFFCLWILEVWVLMGNCGTFRGSAGDFFLLASGYWRFGF
jgi:hypothetical protein